MTEAAGEDEGGRNRRHSEGHRRQRAADRDRRAPPARLECHPHTDLDGKWRSECSENTSGNGEGTARAAMASGTGERALRRSASGHERDQDRHGEDSSAADSQHGGIEVNAPIGLRDASQPAGEEAGSRDRDRGRHQGRERADHRGAGHPEAEAVPAGHAEGRQDGQVARLDGRESGQQLGGDDEPGQTGHQRQQAERRRLGVHRATGAGREVPLDHEGADRRVRGLEVQRGEEGVDPGFTIPESDLDRVAPGLHADQIGGEGKECRGGVDLDRSRALDLWGELSG